MALSAPTLSRIADFLEHGGTPLSSHEYSYMQRVLRLCDGDPEDAAAVCLVQSDRASGALRVA